MAELADAGDLKSPGGNAVRVRSPPPAPIEFWEKVASAAFSHIRRIFMLLIIHFLIIAVLAVLGLVFRKGKGTFLIAGYNTASKAAKEKIDEKKLCRYMSRLMFVLAGCWLIIAACEIFGKIWLLWLGLAMFLISVLIGIIYMNTGGRISK